MKPAKCKYCREEVTIEEVGGKSKYIINDLNGDRHRCRVDNPVFASGNIVYLEYKATKGMYKIHGVLEGNKSYSMSKVGVGKGQYQGTLFYSEIANQNMAIQFIDRFATKANLKALDILYG